MALKFFTKFFGKKKQAVKPSGSQEEEQQGIGISLSMLTRFDTFLKMSDEDLLLLKEKLELKEASKGDVLCKLGDNDDTEYFLVSGTLELRAKDGVGRTVEGNTKITKAPIATLRPRQYTIIAETNCTYLTINRDVLAQLQGDAALDSDAVDDYGVDEIPALDNQEAQALVASFYEDLRNNKFILTSIPDIALRIRSMLDNMDQDIDEIVAVINTDPAIAAKMIKTSNSAFYRGAIPCEDVKSSILRIGTNTSRQLILSFTVRHLFTASSPALKGIMRESWEHSLNVAAIAYTMATDSREFCPEEAMLAGLLSSIGSLSILNYVSNYPDMLEDSTYLKATIHQLKAEVGALVLERWEFPEDVMLCAKHCEDWQREKDGTTLIFVTLSKSPHCTHWRANTKYLR